MENESLVSIIIPVYKVQNYIKECVDSIIHQTYDNIEIILVDDGSPDDCASICDLFLLSDSRIKVIHKNNGGLSSARNCGIDVCGGKYILFVDSDDAINYNSIEMLLSTALSTDADIVQGKGCVLSDKISKDTHFSGTYRIYDSIEYLSLLFSRKKENDTRIVAMNKLYRSDLFLEKRFAEGMIHEDEELIPRILYSANKICIIDARLYYYRIVEGSIMHSAFSEKNYDLILAKQKNISFFTDHGKTELLGDYIVTYLFDLFYLYYETIKGGFNSTKKDQIKTEIKNFFWQAMCYASIADKMRLLKNRCKILLV